MVKRRCRQLNIHPFIFRSLKLTMVLGVFWRGCFCLYGLDLFFVVVVGFLGKSLVRENRKGNKPKNFHY